MTAPPALACPTCALPVPAGLAYCPRCRATAEGRAWDPSEVDRHERTYVLTLVGLSLGVLGVPRAWRSPAFSVPGKLAVTALGVLNTGAAVLLAWWFLAVYLPGALEAVRGAR